MSRVIRILEFATQLKAVLFWQNNIQDNTVWPLFEHFLNGLISIDSCDDLKATITEWSRNHCQLCPAIIHDQYFLTRHLCIPFLSQTTVETQLLSSDMGNNGYSCLPSREDITHGNADEDA